MNDIVLKRKVAEATRRIVKSSRPDVEGLGVLCGALGDLLGAWTGEHHGATAGRESTSLKEAAGLVQARFIDLETKLAVARDALLKVQTMMTTSKFGGMSNEQRITCAWAIVEQAYRETVPAPIVKPFTLVDRSEQGAVIAADALRMGAAQREYRGRRAHYTSLTKAQKRKFNEE